MDETHRIFVENRIVLPRRSEEMDIFVKQCCSTVKILETNKKSGISTYHYRPVGSQKDDDYRHALNYLVLAMRKSKIISEYTDTIRQTQVISDYAVI
jgi:hypothetical protein